MSENLAKVEYFEPGLGARGKGGEGGGLELVLRNDQSGCPDGEHLAEIVKPGGVCWSAGKIEE